MSFSFTDVQKDRITGLYQVATPQLQANTEQASFYTHTSLGLLYFTVIYWEGQWWGTSQISTIEKLRSFRLVPNLLLMDQYDNYGLLFLTDYDIVPLNGFNSLDIRLVLW